MTTITIELPEGYMYETKINGQAIRWDASKMHESWLLRFLEKGFQRYANDMYSGEKGQTKYDLVMGVAKEANSGEPAPERAMRKASLPDDQALAVKMAKQDLTLVFKKITGAGRIADMVEHEKVKAFFNVSESAVVWNDDAVLKWIAKQAEANKRDYLAEAKTSLAAMEDIDLDI